QAGAQGVLERLAGTEVERERERREQLPRPHLNACRRRLHAPIVAASPDRRKRDAPPRRAHLRYLPRGSLLAEHGVELLAAPLGVSFVLVSVATRPGVLTKGRRAGPSTVVLSSAGAGMTGFGRPLLGVVGPGVLRMCVRIRFSVLLGHYPTVLGP